MIEIDAPVFDRSLAACKGKDTKMFFADTGPLSSPEVRKTIKNAKLICKSCEIQAECLLFAVNNDEEFGIWGGFTRKERKKYFGEKVVITHDKAMRAAIWTRSS